MSFARLFKITTALILTASLLTSCASSGAAAQVQGDNKIYGRIGYGFSTSF